MQDQRRQSRTVPSNQELTWRFKANQLKRMLTSLAKCWNDSFSLPPTRRQHTAVEKKNSQNCGSFQQGKKRPQTGGGCSLYPPPNAQCWTVKMGAGKPNIKETPVWAPSCSRKHSLTARLGCRQSPERHAKGCHAAVRVDARPQTIRRALIQMCICVHAGLAFGGKFRGDAQPQGAVTCSTSSKTSILN